MARITGTAESSVFSIRPLGTIFARTSWKTEPLHLPRLLATADRAVP